MLFHWGGGLFIGGSVGALLSAAPAALFALAPPTPDLEFLAITGALAVLTVTPMALLTALFGAVLLLIWAFRRWARS